MKTNRRKLWVTVLCVLFAVSLLLTTGYAVWKVVSHRSSDALRAALREEIQQEGAAFVTDAAVFRYKKAGDCVISDYIRDLFGFQPDKILFCTRYCNYFCRTEGTVFTLCRMNRWESTYEVLLTVESEQPLTASMETEACLLLRSGTQTLYYDIAGRKYVTAQEYETLTAAKRVPLQYEIQQAETFSVRRLADDKTQQLTVQHLQQSADFARLSEAAGKPLAVTQVLCYKEKLFLFCQEREFGVLFAYDMDTETATLFSWTEILSDEPCQIFFFS